MRGSSGSTIPRPALCFLALAWPQKLWSAQDKGGVTKIVANEYVMVTVKHPPLTGPGIPGVLRVRVRVSAESLLITVVLKPWL